MPELQVKAYFDPEKCRQYLNDDVTVFHCHHYSTLFTQLADDAKMFNGAQHLSDAMAETSFDVLSRYCEAHDIASTAERVEIAQQYYAYVGLGRVELDLEKACAEMPHSHVDEGWIKKWGQRETPVNFMGQGFIAAAFALAQGGQPADYQVSETQSIVSGAETSRFTVNKK